MAESKPAAYDAVAARAFVAAAERVKPHTKLIALLALGHFVIDVNQGSWPAMLLFLLSSGPLAFVMLALYGGVLTSSFSVSIVLGQSYLPRHAGMASELIVGFAIGLGGAGVTALGWVADRWGVPAALWISAMMPLVAFVPTRFLPPPREAIA
jgi:hypothetical protein